MVNSAVVDLPRPRNLNYLWNFGSLLGLCLGLQLISGIIVSAHYCRDLLIAFDSVRHLSRDVNYGWLIRIIHANGARLFFIFLYLHTARGLYYSSYMFILPWIIGVFILLITIATAFLGYVLPWGQISFWGATVITNLFSAIPYLGPDIVTWLWGGFAVDKATLSRFYSFHFIFPFLILGIVAIHLLFLHEYGSSNALGLNSNYDKIFFMPYYLIKDLGGYVITFLFFIYFIFYKPWYFGDPENFISANPLVTPLHIQPEWYFLFAYAILRSIPNKLGGVLALVASVVILFILPYIKFGEFKGCKFYFILKVYNWFFFVLVLLLTWIGARPVEEPYVFLGQLFTVGYFIYYGLLGVFYNLNKFLFLK